MAIDPMYSVSGQALVSLPIKENDHHSKRCVYVACCGFYLPMPVRLRLDVDVEKKKKAQVPFYPSPWASTAPRISKWSSKVAFGQCGGSCHASQLSCIKKGTFAIELI